MHEGHRSRLIGRVIDGGSLYPHELLEALMFPACPRRDLNPVAHRLLKKFKTFGALFSAGVEELASVDGVGKNLAKYLYCLGGCLAGINGGKCFTVLRSTEQYVNFVKGRPASAEDEFEICVCDEYGRAVRMYNFPAKPGCRAEVTPAEILKSLALSKAFGVFTAYKYSCGDGAPTEEDDRLLTALYSACRMTGTRLYDFIIFSPSGNTFSYFVEDRNPCDGLLKGELILWK